MTNSFAKQAAQYATQHDLMESNLKSSIPDLERPDVRFICDAMTLGAELKPVMDFATTFSERYPQYDTTGLIVEANRLLTHVSADVNSLTGVKED